MKEQSNLAPIVLITYNRYEHTVKCINSLKKISFQKNLIFIIYSDGLKNHSEKDKLLKIRKYLRNIKGFKSKKLLKEKKILEPKKI